MVILKQPLFQFRVKNFVFAPRLIPTLVTFIILPLLIYLGFWQIHRGEYKQALLEQYLDRAKAAPISLKELNNLKNLNAEHYQYYPLVMTGHYDNQHTLLLDNKTYHKQVGYQILTPFIPDDSKQMVLINRGWMVRNPDRRILPIIPNIQGSQKVIGMIYIPTAKTFLLSHDISSNSWPRIIQTIAIAQIKTWLERPLYPWVILLSPESANGFVREWNPITVTPYKNYAYALQWFGLAITLLSIFIGVNTRREK